MIAPHLLFDTKETNDHKIAKWMFKTWMEEGHVLYPFNEKSFKVVSEFVVLTDLNNNCIIPANQLDDNAQQTISFASKHGYKPFIVFDLFVQTVSGKRFGVEIVKSSPCSSYKIKKLKKVWSQWNICSFEIDANDVLSSSYGDWSLEHQSFCIEWLTPH